MFNKLKQYKDIRDQAKNLQNKLADESIIIKEAGDKLILTMDGNLKITGLAIDDDLMDVSQKDKLIKAIKNAHESGMKKMQRIMAMKMKEMGGLPNIPGLN